MTHDVPDYARGFSIETSNLDGQPHIFCEHCPWRAAAPVLLDDILRAAQRHRDERHGG